MSKTKFFQIACSVLVAASICLPIVSPFTAMAEEEDAKKPSIKAVMKTCFKGPLLKKVASGTASDEEKKELHAMLVAMSKATPPRGSEESWNKLNKLLVEASQKIIKGDAQAAAMLKNASNCKACHSEHKPS
ncbi:hypothetical protein [Novipirellula caenicola]|uniref:Cytochrome C n=1 Tax=Novipirellula caenicola TaxID=1536901 RepID=A0ABP9VYV3_9BACT